jgi:thymidine phosphorylase
MAGLLPQEIIRRKRDGQVLTDAELRSFAQGIADERIGEAQIAAFAMAVCWRGMDTAEAVSLTLAMRDSGRVLDWADEHLPGPVLDKHSTGGIGDTVSLMLGPMLAACGGFVPMISGRGLGHTGGTLDKLEAIPGYRASVSVDQLRRVVREAGVAIVGAGDALAPADRRFYAVRDVTATVESVPLITASILAKKLAAGLGALVLDVKFGNGAFMQDIGRARELARSLVEVGCGAGLPTQALLTDMNQALAPAAGNALEVQVALDYLRGVARPARLHAVVMALGAAVLVQAGLAADDAEARVRLQRALDSGAAAERFARMVAGLGGPADVLAKPGLPAAAVVRDVDGVEAGFIAAVDTRALGMAVVALGGGRRGSGDTIDPAVGLSDLLPIGTRVDAGMPIARVHARTAAEADDAIAAVRRAFAWSDLVPDPTPLIADPITRNLP